MKHDQFEDYVSGSLYLPEHDCQVVVEKNSCRTFLEAAFKQGYGCSHFSKYHTWYDISSLQRTMLKARETTMFYISHGGKMIGSGPASPYSEYENSKDTLLFENVFVPDTENPVDFEEIQQLIHL